MTRGAGREHAIEHVDPAVDSHDQIFGCANTHEVAGAIRLARCGTVASVISHIASLGSPTERPPMA